MDKKTLLVFARNILTTGSREKSMLSLRQLYKLLKEQGAPQEMLSLLEQMIQSVPEMEGAARSKAVLTEEDVFIARRRAKEREAREAAARNYGRC